MLHPGHLDVECKEGRETSSVFPALALVHATADRQEQEISAVIRELDGARARILELETAAKVGILYVLVYSCRVNTHLSFQDLRKTRVRVPMLL